MVVKCGRCGHPRQDARVEETPVCGEVGCTMCWDYGCDYSRDREYTPSVGEMVERAVGLRVWLPDGPGVLRGLPFEGEFWEPEDENGQWRVVDEEMRSALRTLKTKLPKGRVLVPKGYIALPVEED